MPRYPGRRRGWKWVAAAFILIPGGCTWTSGKQALTVEEYRTLETRWAEERERRLEALLDERFEALREQEERLQTLEQHTEGILAGLRELEAAQRTAARNSAADADDSADDGGGNGSGAADTSANGDDADNDELELGRDPDPLTRGEPLVFGSAECLGLPEQDLVLRARVDTGANTASLGAIDIDEFERDGDAWVRFRLPYSGTREDSDSGDGEDDKNVFDEVLDVVNGESENEETTGVVVEAEVDRRVTIIQASGEEERVVVRLPTRIGPLDQRVEYTLADRSGMEFPVLLGRRLLQDVAVVDVAREYVQSCPPD